MASERLKTSLIQNAAPTRRGTNATISQQKILLHQIKELEKMNVVENPAASSSSIDINGWWSLIYQSTPEPSTKWDPNTEVEGPFLSIFKPFTKDMIKSRGNFQEIDVANGKVQNLARFSLFGKPGIFNILGSCSVPEVSPLSRKKTRFDVTFDKVTVEVPDFSIFFNVPLTWIRPKGWVETTYLDPEFRIGRGDKGSVFVAVRSKINPGIIEPS
mmetsp:Transcript_11299/g.18055  ORF Transcript_11299/g.18055 Transcript_11299/m.18055 type:complete len:215 (+) Transcript_11299:415-1059(+)